jgi:hypothetical protein
LFFFIVPAGGFAPLRFPAALAAGPCPLFPVRRVTAIVRLRVQKKPFFKKRFFSFAKNRKQPKRKNQFFLLGFLRIFLNLFLQNDYCKKWQ